MELSGWGRYPRFDSTVFAPANQTEVFSLQHKLSHYVARGNGRAYGDAAIGTMSSLSMLGLDRLGAFDPATGLLTVEAGTLLADIIETFLPKGYFPPVVPGTKFVTVGGMIAADVHGKNHHAAGSFGTHVISLRLALPSGEVAVCSRTENEDLFDATIGGMGLTGVILDATFRMMEVPSGWVQQETVVAKNLETALESLSSHEDATYCAAWIDCLATGKSLGRSLVYLGEHATPEAVDELKPGAPLFPTVGHEALGVPLDFPSFALNRLSVTAFNMLYFRKGALMAGVPYLSGIDPSFFPLDGVHDWNRIYGKRGFVQHQSVIPEEKAQSTLAEILRRIANRGNASFLAVLKKFGASSSGILSFPSPGYSLALDFSIDRGLFEFLDEIDKLVIAAGGRIYLAKDARQSAATFAAGYPGLERFREIRAKIGADTKLTSHLSERLGI
ncbi:FAD-binding oxidoreductase [Beijerinckia indica]|uniref:FAD linked oxidase domain protein n=1 Tax=Beijerinckia indica subsp. indica (strain ATCC 9039 / DSM 1715 / NCIMB 8712) TaxID=395963 RepID=B2II87_BEII9|nr:FAD-binding oxidoreductase [Beijerinckia indica]ACB94670.1 FAD linked oxidase domain protein [Beijerinckia indica subsp. indica ATCC 9039]